MFAGAVGHNSRGAWEPYQGQAHHSHTGTEGATRPPHRTTVRKSHQRVSLYLSLLSVQAVSFTRGRALHHGTLFSSQSVKRRHAGAV
eukprot:254731-Pyramimonas_sp.AAC.1